MSPPAALPIHQVIALPRGQTEAQAAQDRYECYRMAQPGGFDRHVAGDGAAAAAGAGSGALGGAIAGAVAGGARGAAAGGALGGLFGAIIAAEIADARARPVDLDRYTGCLRQRDYDVRRP